MGMEKERNTIPIIPPDLAKAGTWRGIPMPTPSLEHTLIDCGQCGRKGWIGPAQRMKLLFNDVDVLCYWCIFAEMEEGVEMEINKPLDRTADERQRRW